MSPGSELTVQVSEQVLNFVRGQAPETRRQLRLALRKLAGERGDIKALEGPLAGFHRLRVGSYRIVFAYVPDSRAIRCIFAQQRSVVYLLMEDLLRRKLLAGIP